jgi:hypothetical protein
VITSLLKLRVVYLTLPLLAASFTTFAADERAGYNIPDQVPSTAPCSSALKGTHKTFDVGPQRQFEELDKVPWLSLQGGDVVNIYYRPEPYRTYLALRAEGSAKQPVVINGVTDSPTAPCRRPEISGDGAHYAADRNGYDLTGDNSTRRDQDILIWSGQGQWGRIPRFITIQNLRLTGGRTGIYAVTVEDLLVSNCEITQNVGWGIFVNTKNDEPNGEETSKRITIRGNRVFGNGLAGSYLYHNLYLQARRTLVEGNFIGQLVPGARGSSLKDRSSGTVIRYNTILAAARALDLVETEGGHGEHGNPNQVDTDPLYPDAWVYGNLIINDGDLPGESSASLIHWGFDNNFDRARKGTLHFFANTLLSSQRHGDIVLFDQQSNNDDRDPHNVVELSNNIIWQTGGAQLLMGKTHGVVKFVGGNWLSSGWSPGLSGNSIEIIGASSLIQGANPLLSCVLPSSAALDCRPRSGSAALGAAIPTPTLPPVLFAVAGAGENAEVAIAGTTARSGASDSGAFEH